MEVFLGAALVVVLVLGTRVFRRPVRRALPRPAGRPEDRAEAVRRVLKHMHRKTVAELEEGTAAVIVGVVQEIAGAGRLRSPIAGTDCLGYHTLICHAVLGADLQYRRLHEHARMVDFVIADDTGAIRVEANGIELAITESPTTRFEPPLPAVLGAVVPRFLHADPIHVREGLVHAGALLLVCGVTAREPTATEYRDGAQRLVLRASPRFPLVASSDADLIRPGDRPIEPEELYARRSGD